MEVQPFRSLRGAAHLQMDAVYDGLRQQQKKQVARSEDAAG